MSVLPDAPADRDETNADADVGKEIDRALHRIGDGEVGVLSLRQAAHEKNAARETYELHEGLDDCETPYDARAMKRLPNNRRGTLVKNRGRDRTEKAHRANDCMETVCCRSVTNN